jgi:hypothetical protein
MIYLKKFKLLDEDKNAAMNVVALKKWVAS